MLETKLGTIIAEVFSRQDIKGFTVQVEDRIEKCIVYPGLVGDIEIGDEVLLNTTAQTLQLGSGGYHYVITALKPRPQHLAPGGHIMKVRYTPLQIKVLSVEEEDSPFHEEMLQADSLDNTPVLAATLHSMLAPLCMELNENGLKTAYVMTDGAALPIAFSSTVDWLKKKGMLAGTITVGHAFGGDLEAVNIYSGLLAAKKVIGADVIVVSMGPGIVGMGTKWGFSGIEQGDILNAVDTLQGIPIAVPRISFADKRERHRGLSHHTRTVLSRVCKVSSLVTLPMLEKEKNAVILEQVRSDRLMQIHRLCMEDANSTIQLIKESGLKVSTMGRGVDEEREFFMALGASAKTAVRLINGQRPQYLQMV